MAPELALSVVVAAAPETIYDALITSEGLASFWTADSRTEPVVGYTARLGFPSGSKLDLRVEHLEPGQRVAWTLLNDVKMGPHWTGTSVSWDLTPGEDGSTTVLFRQTGWPDATVPTDLAGVTYAWAQILRALKGFVETGQSQPHFRPVEAKIG